MKIVVISVIVIAVLWFIAIKIQEFQRIPTANQLIDEKIKELKALGFEKLVEMIGKGYIQDNIVRNGITYYMGYVILKPNVIGGMHTNTTKEVISIPKPGEVINEVEITGYVDCITAVPFIYFKMGPSFRMVINNKGEIVTPQ